MDKKRVAFSVAEFCQITGLSAPTVRRRIADKTIESVKIGNRVLIPSAFIKEVFGAVTE